MKLKREARQVKNSSNLKRGIANLHEKKKRQDRDPRWLGYS